MQCSQELVMSSHMSQCALILILQFVMKLQLARIVMVTIAAYNSGHIPQNEHQPVFCNGESRSLWWRVRPKTKHIKQNWCNPCRLRQMCVLWLQIEANVCVVAADWGKCVCCGCRLRRMMWARCSRCASDMTARACSLDGSSTRWAHDHVGNSMQMSSLP
jgi:hypothetical protein